MERGMDAMGRGHPGCEGCESDEAFILALAEGRAVPMALAPAIWRSHRCIAEHCVARDYRNFEYLSEELRGDPGLIELAIAQSGKCFLHVPGAMRDDPELCLMAVSKLASNMTRVPKALRASRDWLLEACRRNQACYKFVGKRYGEDKSFALEVFESNERFAVSAIPAAWLGDRDFMIQLMAHRHVDHVPKELRGDVEFALAGISNKRLSLKQLSEELKDNEEVVSASIRAIGSFELQHASFRLRDDEHFIMSMMQETPDPHARHGLRLSASNRIRMRPELLDNPGYNIKG